MSCIMPANFTEEERERIRCDLIEAGFQMSRDCGLKGMTVSRLAEHCHIAKGTFYHFFPSKEEFVLALFAESNRRAMEELTALMGGRDRLPVEEMMAWYRGLFTFERNFMMWFTTEDYVWLKGHLRSFGLFDIGQDKETARQLLQLVDGLRPDYDIGVVVNFIKSIYGMTENRDSFCRESIEMNIDLIFQTIYQYIKEKET